jgi:hypothetical protein
MVIEDEVYTWDTLPDSVRDKVRITLAPDGDWYDTVIDDHKEQAKEKGFDIHSTTFSGFWSQGDGASWNGSVVLAKYLATHAPHEPDTKHMILLALANSGLLCNAAVHRSRHSHYAHSGNMTCDTIETFLLGDGEEITHDCIFKGADASALLESVGGEEALTELAAQIQKDVRADADALYKALEAEYEDQSSDEYLRALCAMNEYRFNEDGDIFN